LDKIIPKNNDRKEGNLREYALPGQWKIPFIKIMMQTIDKRAVTKRCRRKITGDHYVFSLRTSKKVRQT
jgi:hypothetical protein